MSRLILVIPGGRANGDDLSLVLEPRRAHDRQRKVIVLTDQLDLVSRTARP